MSRIAAQGAVLSSLTTTGGASKLALFKNQLASQSPLTRARPQDGPSHAIHCRDKPDEPHLFPLPGGPVGVHAGAVRPPARKDEGGRRRRCTQPTAAKPCPQVRQVRWHP